MTQLPDLRHHVRTEQLPLTASVVVRGGPDTAEKLRRHAERVRRAFVLDGAEVLGISVFCVVDEVGTASLETILAQKLGSYRSMHVTTVGKAYDAGFDLLPTFDRPHYTLLLSDPARVGSLLELLGPEQANPRYGQKQRPARRRPR